MSDDKSRMKPSDRHHLEAELIDEVRAFLDGLEQCGPTWEDGEYHSLEIRGGRVGYTDDDHPLFSFSVKRTQEQAL